jgi:hypothetical protein
MLDYHARGFNSLLGGSRPPVYEPAYNQGVPGSYFDAMNWHIFPWIQTMTYPLTYPF